MKEKLLICLVMAFGSIFLGADVRAIDVNWMQKGVRVWYFGAASTGFSSDAEEAYLFGTIDGNSVPVTCHSAINHWGSPNPVDTQTYSLVDKGPCWIHPQVLQNLQSGDMWRGHEIVTVLPGSYTYDTFKNQFPSFNYLLLPIKALFDLKAQRDLVKIVYMMPGYSTGIAFFDTDTGILLLYETSNGFVTVFFILSEINYDFATQKAFAEDDGPHTGFKSNALETTTTANYVYMQSSVESRYGSTVQMWVSASGGGSMGSWMPSNENYCFFGNVPALRHIVMTNAQYPPELWPELGDYLWWWVPRTVLQSSTIDVFGVPMTRTSTSPYTFTATTEPAGFFFSKIVFGDDGYMTSFSAKYSAIGLNIGDNIAQNSNSVDGLSY